MHLDRYTVGDYSPGAPLARQVLWFCVGSPLVLSRFTPSALKCWLLKFFGTELGRGVRIKPGVRIKFPWRLTIGDFVWLGENCWIDNVAQVTIGSNVCISQDAFLCTGNHNWSHPRFQLSAAPIQIESSCWIAARAMVGPGVTVGEGAVLSLGSVAGKSLQPMTIYVGNPAQPVKARRIERDQVELDQGSDQD